MDVNSPFSVRYGDLDSMSQPIDQDFPKSAVTGLCHVLSELHDKGYLYNSRIEREISRLSRTPPWRSPSPPNSVFNGLEKLSWSQIYDLCERIPLLIRYNLEQLNEDPQADIEFEKVLDTANTFLHRELNLLFSEENLAYIYEKGLVVRRGRKNTENQIGKATTVLDALMLRNARQHYIKALRFFRDAKEPDYPNCIKEAVCSVEAAGKASFPDAGATTLGDLTKWLKKNRQDALPYGVINIITGLYTYRSGGEGVSHGEANGGNVSKELAEFTLSVASSTIVLFYELNEAEEDEASLF